MKESVRLIRQIGITFDDYIIVGCSSGPDSMCLLDILYNNNYKVVCAHINHNIRKESLKEFQFLEDYCHKKNIIFEGLQLKKEKNKNENYYRKKRYDFYKKLADKYNSKYILTAHHGDDLIETILMRISRGSNLKGYIGFSNVFYEKNYILIKPLIYYNKDEIVDYDKKHNIPYFNDITNKDDKYTRNRYRNYVLPFLKKENPNVHKKYLKFSEELNNARKYIYSVALKEKENNYFNNTIDLTKFNNLDDYIKQCELEIIFAEIYGDDINNVSDKHIMNILDLLKNNKNFSLNLPKKIIVNREYNLLRIKYINNQENKYKILLEEYNSINNGDVIEIINDSPETSNYITRLNSKEINMPLFIRTVNKADTICVKNMTHNKKVARIFIDEKLPKSERETYPIVVDSNDNVIWIPGLKKSKFDNEKNKKYDIILKYTRKEK